MLDFTAGAKAPAGLFSATSAPGLRAWPTIVCFALAEPNAEDAIDFCDRLAPAAASGGVLGTPIAPFGNPAGAIRGAGGAFESGPGGASEPQGTAGLVAGLSAGRSACAAFALGAAPTTGAAPPDIGPWSGFVVGAGLSGVAGPSNVFLNADGAAGLTGAAGAAGLAAKPKADAAPVCSGFASGAAGFAKAEPAAPSDGAAIGLLAADGCESASTTLPSLAITKLVLHFGQRIFMPDAGMRRSSTSYGDLHDTHATLIMDDRTALLTLCFLHGALRRDETPNGCTLHGLRISRDTRA
jgi:hypothetical protein